MSSFTYCRNTQKGFCFVLMIIFLFYDNRFSCAFFKLQKIIMKKFPLLGIQKSENNLKTEFACQANYFKTNCWLPKNHSQLALRSGDTIASEVLTEAWLLLIEN